MKGNLRDKRSDPWLRANAPSKAAADPKQMAKTRTNHNRVFAWFASRRPQALTEASLEASLNNSVKATSWTALL